MLNEAMPVRFPVHSSLTENAEKASIIHLVNLQPVLRIRIRIRIRIHRIHVFLGRQDPDPDPLVRVMDPDPDPSIIMQK